MKYLRITMPDGSKWEVAASRIAKNRATNYSHSGAEYQKEEQYTLDNPDVLIDWAENNMDWNMVREQARLVSVANVDYQEGWVNGEKEITEV